MPIGKKEVSLATFPLWNVEEGAPKARITFLVWRGQSSCTTPFSRYTCVPLPKPVLVLIKESVCLLPKHD